MINIGSTNDDYIRLQIGLMKNRTIITVENTTSECVINSSSLL